LVVNEGRLGGTQTLYEIFRENKNTMTLTVTANDLEAASP